LTNTPPIAYRRLTIKYEGFNMKPNRLSDEQLAEACKALGHPARIKIIRHLIEEDRCICGRIVEVIGLAQSTVSQHLKILKKAGLVDGEVEGPKTCYCVDKNAMASLNDAIDSIFTPLPEVQS
jgi:DNA-binding transcriptional ArsR family regulator